MWLTRWDPVAHTGGFLVPYLQCRLQAGPNVRLAPAPAPPRVTNPLGAGQGVLGLEQPLRVAWVSAPVFLSVPETGRQKACGSVGSLVEPVRIPRSGFGVRFACALLISDISQHHNCALHLSYSQISLSRTYLNITIALASVYRCLAYSL